MDSPVIPRWLHAGHWPGLLGAHLDPALHRGVLADPEESPRWDTGSGLMQAAFTEQIETIPASSLDAVWLEDTSPAMAGKLAAWWGRLKPGGYLGGPSCGFGFTSCGRWTLGTEATVKAHARSNPDCSEIFTGNEPNPCWFVFKKTPPDPRVLVLSGCDRVQYESFGASSRDNHRAYAAARGYDCCWMDWEEFWNEPRHYSWAKILAVIRKLESGSWDQVWWIDADAVFLDFGKRLDGFLHPSWTGVFPEFIDGRVMASTGVWGSTPGQLPGLRDAWNREECRGGCYEEEMALADSIHEASGLWCGNQFVDHRLFNGVPEKGIAYTKAEDNFILHFAACGNDRRREIIGRINEFLDIGSS